MLMLNRGFFSLQAPWTPTAVAAGNLVLNAVLFAAFYRLGTWGIPLAISVANIAGAAALLLLLRRRVGQIDFLRIARTFALVSVASAVLAAAAYGAWWALDEVLGDDFAAQALALAGGLVQAGFVMVYAGMVARIYAQLSAPQTGVPDVAREG